ncbi:MAG: RraA family protein [Azospirillaceae bacterium]
MSPVDADALAERLARCYSGAVFDALRERGITDGILPPAIRPLDPARTLAGPVFTMEGSRKSGLSDDESLLAWTGFLSRAPAGSVVVCRGNVDDLALMGELSAETLHHRGVRGYVTDGACRDADFILRLGFPVFCDGLTPRDIVGVWSPDAYDEPVVLGDTRVAPGDFLIADRDGGVVIPGANAAEVVAEVEAVMATENRVRTAILDGVSPEDAYRRYGRF